MHITSSVAEFDNSFPGSERMIVFSTSDLESHIEGKLDSVQYIFEMQIFELTESLNLASN